LISVLLIAHIVDVQERIDKAISQNF